jgi:nucleoid-associated protein YgaU
VSDHGSAADVGLACPFVAFADDRDSRSTRPDHRHRCYAEARPAPRATAHQEAYCLSAGFARCPTFVDWARREAARATPAADVVRSGIAGGSVPDPTRYVAEVEDEVSTRDAGESPGSPSALVDEASGRPSTRTDRDWAAPPPWRPERDPVADGTADGAPRTDGVAAAGAGATGAAAMESASTAAEVPSPAPSGPVEADAPSFLAQRQPATPSRAAAPSAGMPPVDLDDELEAGRRYGGGAIEDDEAEEPMRRFGPGTGRSRYASSAGRAHPPDDPDAPPWERPRRFEAYPTIKTRGSLALSPILIGIAVIAIGAVVLFFVPPLLLGLGGSGSGATPTPSSVASASAADASPTPVPSPTPQIYVVKTGDTLSKIAKAHGVTLDALIAANQDTIKDPNKLQVGEKIIIPSSSDEVAPTPSPSPSP